MKIELWFDVVSPYSFLAYKVLDRYRRQWGFSLVMKPAFLGGLMKSVGNQPPIALAAREPWLREDILAQGRFYDVALEVPNGFPHLTIKAMRVLTALCDRADARAELVADALWTGYFSAPKSSAPVGEAKLPDDDDVLFAACVGAELNAEEIKTLLQFAASDEIKEKLKTATTELEALGAFGMPLIVVETDGNTGTERKRYFGSDRFDRLAFEHGLKWLGPRAKR